jgi:microcompartment protein CcmL/EutN
MHALGLIEVRGYLGAIQAADSALKAANVTCVGCEKVKGGLVTVKLLGDVAAIKAAVEAGERAAQILGVLISSHVIARMHEETEKLIFPQDKKTATDGLAPAVAASSENGNEIQCSIDQYTIPPEKAEEADQQSVSLPREEGAEAEAISIERPATIPTTAHIIRGRLLEDMKVVELRRLARKLKLRTMSFNEIKFAKKDKLIAEIEKQMRGEENL